MGEKGSASFDPLGAAFEHWALAAARNRRTLTAECAPIKLVTQLPSGNTMTAFLAEKNGSGGLLAVNFRRRKCRAVWRECRAVADQSET